MNKLIIILLIILIIFIAIYITKRLYTKKRTDKYIPGFNKIISSNMDGYEYPIVKNSIKPIIPYDPDEPMNKTIYRTWCSKDRTVSCSGRRISATPSRTTNFAMPDWKEKIFTDDEMEEYVRDRFGEDHIVTKSFLLINPKFAVMKSDFFRYIIIYMEGGIYLDMKSCITHELPPLPKDKSLMCVHGNKTYCRIQKCSSKENI